MRADYVLKLRGPRAKVRLVRKGVAPELAAWRRPSAPFTQGYVSKLF
jgi:hypothetical protein